MSSRSPILAEALAAISSGIDHYPTLFDHLLDHTDLEAEAFESGDPPDDYLYWLLSASERVLITDHDEVFRLDEVAESLVFTHRVTAEEVAHDMVELVPDLPLLDLGTEGVSTPSGRLHVEFGNEDGSSYSPNGSWVGPSGWLTGFAAGDLVAFRRVGDQVIAEAVSEVGDGEAEAMAIAEVFEIEIGYDAGRGDEPEYLVKDAVLADPTLFRDPVRPISELLADAGLSVEGPYVGPVDAPWQPPDAAIVNAFRSHLSDFYRFNACCDEAFGVVLGAWAASRAGDTFEVGAVNKALGHGGVVEAFSDWAARMGGLDADTLGDFATALVSVGRRGNAAARMLHARHLEAVGESLAAEASLENAIVADPDFGPALAELAMYASDRGDAPRVITLLRRAGVGPEDAWLSFHESLGSALPEVGRNQPCPCGSGRKYKQCHLGRTEVSVHERVTWLIGKLTMFATRDDFQPQLIGLAMSAMWEDFEVVDLGQMRRDEFIVDLAVFEGGVISVFLDRRGELLPDDEVDILARWENSALALWEVTSTDDISTLTVRDTKTGEVETVPDRASAERFRPGDQILARVLPAWGGTWFSGPIVPVAPQHRAALLEVLDHFTDADSLASWYGSLHAPPHMANREGEPLALGESP